ncbi:hypothetical protein FZC35_00025 [Candidatus Cytomitobacter indipagum]|uniref:Outer membrane protein assembly factor BamE n=1 Tax=Candidatus Cytomitobacter indipagum TaxID=2601575 RepID=A0A5C0UCN5_9PROT|nr:hypothetical protein [Candidatus Cytomitobacter indipagum]QEK37786.1 hypothetical protein FZC35_00025 [Candidatus Cytomitobacter indipagum]
MKIFVAVVAFLLYGCDSKHGFIMNKSVLGISENDLYSKYGKSVISHPMNKNALFYFESYGKKMNWARIEIKNGKVCSYNSGFSNSKPRIANHVKPNLVKTKWIDELFSYIGSASTG